MAAGRAGVPASCWARRSSSRNGSVRISIGILLLARVFHPFLYNGARKTVNWSWRVGGRPGPARPPPAPMLLPHRAGVGPSTQGGTGMGLLDGKVGFVTGAGHGQGRSHAIRMAREGADVVLCDICAPIRQVGNPMATPEEL